MSRRNRALGVLRLLLLWAAILSLIGFSRPTRIALAIGIPLVAIGEAVRIWAAGYLRKSVELAIDGPYRYSRNPLYLGRLLILSGLLAVSPLPAYSHVVLWVVAWVLFFAYYLPRKERVEPAGLERLHGNRYREYRRRVPALWPTLRPFPPGEGAWSATRFTTNREHWMVIGLTAFLGIQAYRVFTG